MYYLILGIIVGLLYVLIMLIGKGITVLDEIRDELKRKNKE